MEFYFTGTVTIRENEYFNCLASNLLIRVYEVTIGSTSATTYTTGVATNGSFTLSAITESNAAILKLFLVEDELEYELQQSQRFCNSTNTQINFSIDVITKGISIYNRLYDRVADSIADPGTPETVLPTLNDEGRNDLLCLACIKNRALTRLENTLKLWSDFLAFKHNLPVPYTDYPSAGISCEEFASDAEIGKAVFFVLGATTNVLHIALSHSRAQFQKILEDAAGANEIIPSIVSGSILDYLEGCRNAVLFNANRDGAFYPAKLIHLIPNEELTSGQEEEEKGNLLNRCFDFGIDKVIEDVVPGTGSSAEPLISLRVLSEHVLNFAPFLKITITSLGTYEPDYFTVAKLGPEYWYDLMPGLSGDYPDRYSESDFPDEDYANDIYENISADFATARLLFNLADSSVPSKTTLIDVFEVNPEFNIAEKSAVSYFTIVEDAPVASEGEVDSETFKKIQQLQRCLRLTGENQSLRVNSSAPFVPNSRLSGVTALISTVGENPGIDSAAGIGAIGKLRFIEIMEGAEISAQLADQIYCNSKAINEANVAALVEAYQYDRDTVSGTSQSGSVFPHLFNLNQIELPGDTLPPGGLPNMESIFGNFGSCFCSDCESVYSPAAYLTDMLNWLHKDVVCAGPPLKRALEALKKSGTVNRRSDIVHLFLNCENTNTLIPHVDLVNEILTLNLKPYLSGNPLPTSTDFEELQTNKPSEELLTDPEKRTWFEDTQDLLKATFAPWQLPYNVPYNEALLLLNGIGKPYHELIKDFSRTPARYSDIAWAQAILNLNPEETTLLINSHSSPGLYTDYWGIDVPTGNTIGAFLDAAKMTIVEFEEVLGAYYITGSAQITLEEPLGDKCDVDNYVFSIDITANEGVSDRLMRFIRLMKKTGLTVWELDRAISTLTTTGIDSAFIIKLASCIAFSKKYRIDFAEALVWTDDDVYSVAYSASKSSYFKDKFTNPLLLSDIREFFGTTATHNYTNKNIGTDLTNQRKQFLSSVFQVSPTAIDGILNYLVNMSSPPLTLTSSVADALEYLDRYSSFVKIFRIADNEIELTLELLGDPFLSADVMKAAWDFSERLEKYSSLAITLTNLKNIVEGTGDFSLLDLEEDAEALWIIVEKAFQDSRMANPEKEFDTITGLPGAPGDEDFFADVILRSMDMEFRITTPLLNKIIEDHSANWLVDFITHPDTNRDWTTFNTIFTPVYRVLKRIGLLQELLGMDTDGLKSAVEIVIDGSPSIPGTPFYWVTDSFTAITGSIIDQFLRIKQASYLIPKMDLPQSTVPGDGGFYYFVAHYLANYTSSYTSASPANIVTFFNSFGADSTYSKLSAHEFTEIFLRARAICTDSTDLISVMTSFDIILLSTTPLNVGPLDAWNWVWDVWNGSFVARIIDYEHTEDIRRCYRNKFKSFKSYSEAILPIQDELRISLRDALIAFYIKKQGFSNANGVYAYYLIDPLMEPCMLTSRILSAISSVQLLVHRALLKQENDICIDKADKKEWEWRKNYRVWEANRKVFLYPENWIDPSLRRDKTQLFTQFEELLLQNELNDRYSEQAYANYLTGLHEVANLDVRATYLEDSGAASTREYRNSPGEILHVFARTFNAPYNYYHRKFVQGHWLGWEKIEVEIDSDHLIPIMFNRRLYLIFPLFLDKTFANKKENGKIKPFLEENRSKPYYEIKFCYTKYDFGRWSQKRMINGKLLAGNITMQGLENNKEERLHMLVADDPNPGIVKSPLPNNVYKSPLFSYHNYVSMKREDFYFWADLNTEGSLKIHCYRALDPFHRSEGNQGMVNTYTEFAIEYSAVINPTDESMTVEAPAADVYQDYGSGIVNEETKLRFLARPYMTMPHFQQMKWGKAYFKKNVTSNTPTEYSEEMAQAQAGMQIQNADFGLFVKKSLSPGEANQCLKLMNIYTPSTILYPHQFKHSTIGQPFFFYDGVRSYFFRFEAAPAVLLSTTTGSIGSS